jgi:hypothetical protein
MLGPALTHLLQTIGTIAEAERSRDQQALYGELRLLSDAISAASLKESYASMTVPPASHVVAAGDPGFYTTKPYKPPPSRPYTSPSLRPTKPYAPGQPTICTCCNQPIKPS